MKWELLLQCRCVAAQSTVEKETPAQAEARVNASKKLERERFSGVWNFFKQVFHQNM